MTEMLDRAADALKQRFKDRVAASASTPEKPVTFEQTGVSLPADEVWRDYARTVIEALREPTQAMCDVGFVAPPDDQGRFDNYPEQHRLAMGPKWRAMIDEALKE